jgi:DNA-binding transcriptional LysR family regulator
MEHLDVKMMDLRQLRYVVAIADSGSTSAAAAVSQSAVSRQMLRLEEQVGGLLFQRIAALLYLKSVSRL